MTDHPPFDFERRVVFSTNHYEPGSYESRPFDFPKGFDNVALCCSQENWPDVECLRAELWYNFRPHFKRDWHLLCAFTAEGLKDAPDSRVQVPFKRHKIQEARVVITVLRPITTRVYLELRHDQA